MKTVCVFLRARRQKILKIESFRIGSVPRYYGSVSNG